MNNLGDVLQQLISFGLKPKTPLQFGNFVRCKVEGDNEKRGWYALHQVKNNAGEFIIIGGYGIWQGSDNNAQKIEVEKTAFTPEQRKAFAQRIADDNKRAEAERVRRAEQAALKSEAIWEKHLHQNGDCDYLQRKNISALGVKFSDKNSLVIPMRDNSGRVHGLQIIYDRQHSADIIKKRGRDKEYFPTGLQKKGRYHAHGLITNIVLVAEGYATAATLHKATNLPIVVAFDANNIEPVIGNLRKKHPHAKILICADLDNYQTCDSCKQPLDVDLHPHTCPHCEQPHKRKNAGVEAAELAALTHACAWVAPKFQNETARFEQYASKKIKNTDFNDLAALEGLDTVSLQIENAIIKQNWRMPSAPPPPLGGGVMVKPTVITSTQECIDRFVLVQHMGGYMFDKKYKKRCLINDMKQLCTHSDIHRRYFEYEHREVATVEMVGFDPTEKDKSITCNTYTGWPTVPKQGCCDRLLELLEYMCGKEANGRDVYHWLLRWLAFPIQNPGAKMKTAVVVHGPQGTGKNLFFDSIVKIYGKYGGILDQHAIEDKFNDCFESKLFMLADEVVARSEQYHVKNVLKGLITGERLRINPKNMKSFEEKNHVNLVFLSNERVPVIIEMDDRRHQVLWTPEKLGADFYYEVSDEIASGGIEALHYHLKTLDLGDFSEHTKPIMTAAKSNLIDLCKSTTVRFYEAWQVGDIAGIKPMPALSDDVYTLYSAWCRTEGVRTAPKNKAIDELVSIPGVKKERKRYWVNGLSTPNPRMIIYPKHSPELSPGQSEPAWLGEMVSDFKQGVNEFIKGEL